MNIYNISNNNHYPVIVVAQFLLLLFDICVNSFSSFAIPKPVDLLILYIVQDFCLIVALTILLASFFATYIFQAGLIHLLCMKFRITLVLCVFYIILSISLHTWHITLHWSNPLGQYWTKGFHALYSTHRSVSVFYYYYYKRASLRISDPRFYEGSAWLQKELETA